MRQIQQVQVAIESKIASQKNNELSDFGLILADQAISFACEALISCERQLNQLDTGSGDGDCGSTLKRGAGCLLEKLARKDEDMRTVTGIFKASLGKFKNLD